MDMRERRTKRNIANAFIQLRSKKPISKITIKELCELADISKATFYLHYRDIYDLSDKLQHQTVKDLFKFIENPKDMVYNLPKANEQIIEGYYANKNIVYILFSGEFAKLPEYVEAEVKKIIFNQFPELEHDAEANIRITYQIMGSFYAFYKYGNQFDHKTILKTVNHIADMLRI